MPIEVIQFHKKPILRITHSENNLIKIQFGINKAQLLLNNISAIQEFVNKYNPADAGQQPGESVKGTDSV